MKPEKQLYQPLNPIIKCIIKLQDPLKYLILMPLTKSQNLKLFSCGRSYGHHYLNPVCKIKMPRDGKREETFVTS